MMLPPQDTAVLEIISNNPSLSSKEIWDVVNKEYLGIKMSYATLKRRLNNLSADNLISSTGNGRGTKYILSKEFQLLFPLDVEGYFMRRQSDRNAQKRFNFDLIEQVLLTAQLFTAEELSILSELQEEYTKNISRLTETEHRKALEHLSIDLSWKSSEIEGNTRTLLETEALLKNNLSTTRKTKFLWRKRLENT